jgi:hypothetical protein
MRLKPAQDGSFVKAQVEDEVTAAGLLASRRAAGQKNRLRLFHRFTRQIQHLEGLGGDGRNLRPVGDRCGRDAVPLTKCAIGRIAFKLVGEKLQRQQVELPFVSLTALHEGKDGSIQFGSVHCVIASEVVPAANRRNCANRSASPKTIKVMPLSNKVSAGGL